MQFMAQKRRIHSLPAIELQTASRHIQICIFGCSLILEHLKFYMQSIRWISQALANSPSYSLIKLFAYYIKQVHVLLSLILAAVNTNFSFTINGVRTSTSINHHYCKF